jgi:dTDP-4-amino-4,6-dideoxygalactose transaminase
MKNLYVGAPNAGDCERLINRITEIVSSGRLTNNGPCVREFEEKLSVRLGVKHCVAVCNGTMALILAVRALRLRGQVILSSLSFVAAANVLEWHGIQPVFCDIDPLTCNLDPGHAERLVNDRTSAILPTHLWGRPCDVDSIEAIAQQCGIPVLYDAAHAFLCSRQGVMVGNFGAAEVFSFHATKFFNTIEGGAIATNDDTLADRLRALRNFGFTNENRQVEEVGINGKMTEIAAAWGLNSLERVDDFVDTNQRNYLLYSNGLEDISGIRLLRYNQSERSNFQYVIIEVAGCPVGLNRDKLMKGLAAGGVFAKPYFDPPCHLLDAYRKKYGIISLPETERIAPRLLALPTGTSIGPREIEYICGLIRNLVDSSNG